LRVAQASINQRLSRFSESIDSIVVSSPDSISSFCRMDSKGPLALLVDLVCSDPAPQGPDSYPNPLSFLRPALLPPVPIPGDSPSAQPSSSPFPRVGFSVSLAPSGDIYLIGGMDRNRYRNDVYMYSTRDNTTTLFECYGNPLKPGWRNATVVVGNALIAWGGSDNRSALDSHLYILNLGKWPIVFPVIDHLHASECTILN
jgi:hypothetical protein